MLSRYLFISEREVQRHDGMLHVYKRCGHGSVLELHCETRWGIARVNLTIQTVDVLMVI